MLTVYRVTKAAYAATAFAGSRGRGRWHRQGTPVVYAADTPATALLETLVHAGRASLLAAPYVIFRVHLDEERHLVQLTGEALPEAWNVWPWPLAPEKIGTLWFEAETSVALEVPSAVLPLQRNYLLNPRHPDFASLVMDGPEAFPVDPRLATLAASRLP